MTSGLSTMHSATWNPGQTYHIKCGDIWDNENPSCMIVAPSMV